MPTRDTSFVEVLVNDAMNDNVRTRTDLTRAWGNRVLAGVNVCIFIFLIASFMLPGAKFSEPWTGPALASLALTVATIVLAAVALGAAVLAVWGYTTLREHAKNIAEAAAAEVANEVASKVAEQKATATAQAWIDRIEHPDNAAGDAIAQSYQGEERI